MIIDVNAQVGDPWGTRISQTADELLRKMDESGIDRSIVACFPFGNFDNSVVAEAVAAHPDRLAGAVMLSPFSEDSVEDTLRRYVDDGGFIAARLNPAAHGYKLSETRVVEDMLAGAHERNVPVIVYSGDELYAAPLQVMIAAERYPDVRFVMLHSGFMMQTNDAVLVAERCPNVYLEHSSGISAGVTQSVEAVGAERVLFGTDSPYMDAAVELRKLEIAVPDEAQRAKILGPNAQQVFGWR